MAERQRALKPRSRLVWVAGEAYFNIHSTGGEIRGFLAAVPEPATILLLGSTLAGLVAHRRF